MRRYLISGDKEFKKKLPQEYSALYREHMMKIKGFNGLCD